MAKITDRKPGNETLVVKTKSDGGPAKPSEWWKARSKEEKTTKLLGTVAWLKETQQYRYRQASMYARLYSNFPLYGWTGQSMSKMAIGQSLPSDRSTMNVIQSAIDTLVARIIQSRPRPVFLTDNGDYKQRKLAKQLNQFINGEFYQTKAYENGEDFLRDSCILGSGVTKVFKCHNKVKVERRLLTELLVDPSDAMYGCPKVMYEVALIDRSTLEAMFPNSEAKISRAEQAFPDNTDESNKTISDLVMVVEAFRLPSGPESGDGEHIIACTAGMIEEEKWEKDRFPYVIDAYCKRLLGFWGQGAAEQLAGTQQAINRILQTIDQSINLVGVPRVFIEEGSAVVKAHLNNQVGSIVTFRGTKPTYEVAPCVPMEMYAQLERLIQLAYQQVGISQLAAQGQKPQGLDSGEAIRNYDDLQTDRFSLTQKKYSRYYEDLASLIFDTACDIAEETGSYKTVYPNKNGAKEINLPKISDELRESMILQCFDSSALPRDPAGRLQKVTEMIQSGMIDIPEGRRLLDFPDLDQVEQLATASEERILQALDKIVEDGKYTPPDPFMDLQLALKYSVQYYNLYMAANLSEERAEMLRNFNTQVKALIQESMQPPPMQGQAPQPIAPPEPIAPSPLVPQVPNQGVA